MESHQFDRLAKSLISGDTRRGLLRFLLGGSLAVGLATQLEEASGKKRHDHGKAKDRRQRRRKKRQRRQAGSANRCVPLHQVCVPLVGNPCCDKNASCVVSAAGANAEIPDFACRDNSTVACTSDAQCQARFPDAGPDIVCRENTNGIWCPEGIPGTSRCCGRRDCSATNRCQGGACCGLGIGTGEVCCASGQECISFLGCFG